ncbi:unnamed protein product, partial [Meganyctiphanes norvegica]
MQANRDASRGGAQKMLIKNGFAVFRFPYNRSQVICSTRVSPETMALDNDPGPQRTMRSKNRAQKYGLTFKASKAGISRQVSPGENYESAIFLLKIDRCCFAEGGKIINNLSNKVYSSLIMGFVIRDERYSSSLEEEVLSMSHAALEGLDGEVIYTGCCQVRSEFSKAESLNINRNGPDRCDFTIKNAVKQTNGQRSRRGLLGDPPPPNNHTNGHYHDMGDPKIDNSDRYSLNGITDATDLIRSLNLNGGMNGPIGAPLRNGTNNTGRMSLYQDEGSNKSPVVMLYNLSKEMNANRVFNMLCLYGNVFKVKFLRSKEGCAMVEMSDGASVDRAITNLDGTMIFDNKITVAYSKQSYLTEVTEPHELHDGSPSYKNFMSSRNNRFLDPNLARKNRFVKPTRILHFYNTPPGLQEDTIEE